MSEAEGIELAEAGDAAVVATEAFEQPDTAPVEVWRPGVAGWVARRAVLFAVLALAAATPMLLPLNQVGTVSLAFVFIVVGLSINVLMGYLGQISLGHQAFVGVGAFTAALIVPEETTFGSFWAGLIVAGVTGGMAALLLGLVALRLKGLYLALITLAYGAIAENSIFNIEKLTGGGGGAAANRPSIVNGDRAYAYLCLAVVVVLLYVDWRLVRSKVGRAFFAIRDNELAAASFGVNVMAYKLMAFVISGVIAGFAGSLFAHLNQVVVASDFNFFLALTFVLMVVVGGLASRPGVVIGSAFFAVLPLLLHELFGIDVVRRFIDRSESWPIVGPILSQLPDHVAFVGALLLLLTLTKFPGGIAQQMEPVLRWLRGGRIRGHGATQEVVTGGAGVRP